METIIRKIDFETEYDEILSEAAGIIRKGGGVQVVYGPQVSVIKSELEDYIKRM